MDVTPTDRWWECRGCDTRWWGGPDCWCCHTPGHAARPPEFMSTNCALPVIRPEWSTHP